MGKAIMKKKLNKTGGGLAGRPAVEAKSALR